MAISSKDKFFQELKIALTKDNARNRYIRHAEFLDTISKLTRDEKFVPCMPGTVLLNPVLNAPWSQRAEVAKQENQKLITAKVERKEAKEKALREEALNDPYVVEAKRLLEEASQQYFAWNQRAAAQLAYDQAVNTAMLVGKVKAHDDTLDDHEDRLTALEEAQRDEQSMVYSRTNLNLAAKDLEERILKVQIYNHIEMLIAFRMAAPVSLPGLLMFIISASYGDIDFKNQDVQTTLTIGFVATLGVLSAAWYIKSILHRKWSCDVDESLGEYKEELTNYLSKKVGQDAGREVSRHVIPLIEENVRYAQHNFYPHIDTEEINRVGFRQNALAGDKADSKELAHHRDRKHMSTAMTVGINFVGLICGVILAGMAHEKRSFVHKLLNTRPQLPSEPGETPPPANNDSGDWFSTVFGQEPAFYAVAGLLVLGVAMSAFMGIREYNKATAHPVLSGMGRLNVAGDAPIKGFGPVKLKS